MASGASAGSENDPTWTTEEKGNIRKANFTVGDADCAYRVLAEPRLMKEHFPNVLDYTLHQDTGAFQDLTLEERFVKLAKGTSRYHRSLDGRTEVTWTLIEGRQKRHDGTWTVSRTASGGRVEFRNHIEAKKAIERPILRLVQKLTMEDIVDATRSFCGPG